MKNNTHLLRYLKFEKVLKCSKELNQISKTENSKIRNNLIKVARDCVIDAISEIAKNCLYGNIPLKTCDFNKLKKFQNILRRLSKKSRVHQRKKILIQKGGFLNLLIPPALTLIASIVGDLIKKKIRANE